MTASDGDEQFERVTCQGVNGSHCDHTFLEKTAVVLMSSYTS